MAAYARIVVPVDFSDCSNEALRQACDLARRFDSHLHLVHVIEPWLPAAAIAGEFVPDDDTYAVEQRAQAKRALDSLPPPEFGPKPVVRALLEGHPAYEILNYASAHAADLIVLGTHGRKGISRWLMGSVAERVVRHAPCAVLVVRPHTPPHAA